MIHLFSVLCAQRLSFEIIWHSFFNIIVQCAVWNEPITTIVCWSFFMSLLCKWVKCSIGHASGQWLVDFIERWMVKDIHYSRNTESRHKTLASGQFWKGDTSHRLIIVGKSIIILSCQWLVVNYCWLVTEKNNFVLTTDINHTSHHL